jgi:hypothetical protein
VNEFPHARQQVGAQRRGIHLEQLRDRVGEDPTGRSRRTHRRGRRGRVDLDDAGEPAALAQFDDGRVLRAGQWCRASVTSPATTNVAAASASSSKSESVVGASAAARWPPSAPPAERA